MYYVLYRRLKWLFKNILIVGPFWNPFFLVILLKYELSLFFNENKNDDKNYKYVKKYSCLYIYFTDKYFKCGEFRKAINNGERAIKLFPKHVDTYYLVARSLFFLRKHEEALEILYLAINISNRKKTWMYLAQFIHSKSEFLKFEKEFKQRFNDHCSDSTLLLYYSEAARNAGLYKKARNVLKCIPRACQSDRIKVKRIYYRSAMAKNALLDLHDTLTKKNINFFLVSGTLLGCIRNNNLISYDNDIDIGVMNNINYHDLLASVLSSGHYELLATNFKTIIKVKHLNGIKIDIFIHAIKNGKIWHSGLKKLYWVNTMFALKKIVFLDRYFLIPDDYELYLSENYGADWKVPRKNFNSIIDTPNLVCQDEDEYQFQLLKSKILKH